MSKNVQYRLTLPNPHLNLHAHTCMAQSKWFRDMADLGDLQVTTEDASQLQVMCHLHRCCSVASRFCGR